MCEASPTATWVVENTVPNFVNAVNTWVYLSERVVNPFLRRCLFLQIDLFLPRILEVETSGTFATFAVNNSYFWKKLDRRIVALVIQEILPPNKYTGKNPILHLLSKSLPQRCQIRNLSTLSINYSKQSNECYAFLMMIMRKSLFGDYARSKVRLCFEGRVIIYQAFVKQLCSKSFFIRWFRTGPQHQVYLFFCLKEYLINAVKESAPAFEIMDRYQWSKFDTQVSTFMDETRKELNTMAKREYGYLQRSDWLQSIESILQSAAKNHIKLFRTTPVISYNTRLRQDIMKYFNAHEKFDCDSHIPEAVKSMMWNLAQRFSFNDSLTHFLNYCDVDSSVVEAIKNKTFDSKDFHKVSERVLEYITEICRINHIRSNVCVYTLPQHIFDAQKKTLAIRGREDVEDTDLAPPFNPHETEGLNYVCFVCNDIKIFLMKSNSNKTNRHSNRLSRGSLRIVVNNENDKIQLCCGRRPERHTKNSKKKHKDTHDLTKRKERKEKTRNAVAQRCVRTPCEEIDLLGNAFSIFGKLYILCCNCGNACLLDKNAFYETPGALPNCGTCYKKRENTCVKCQIVQVTTGVLCLDRATGRFVTVQFCSACAQAHAKKQPIIL